MTRAIRRLAKIIGPAGPIDSTTETRGVCRLRGSGVSLFVAAREAGNEPVVNSRGRGNCGQSAYVFAKRQTNLVYVVLSISVDARCQSKLGEGLFEIFCKASWPGSVRDQVWWL